MNPEPTWLDPTIRAWLDEPVHIPEDGLAEALRRVHETPQQRHWWPVPSTRRSRSMFSAPRLVVAAALFALTTGAALIGVVGPRFSDPVAAPAAPSSAPSDAATPAPTPSASPVAVASIAETTRDIRSLTRRLENLRSRPDRSAVDQAEIQALAREIATLAQAIEPPAPDVSNTEPKAIAWRTPAVTFEADRLRIRTNDLVFEGVDAPTLRDSAWKNDLELWTEWREHDRSMRLVFQMRADDTHWWVAKIMNYDGMRAGEYLEYPGLAKLTRTPRGESLAMDLRLAPGEANRKELMDDARLRIDGMRLTAFASGTNAAPLEVTGCQPVPADAGVVVEVEDPLLALATAGMDRTVEAIDYFAEGTLLEGIDLLPPQEASERLTELGICHEFTYYYDFIDPKKERAVGTSERWCTMPDVVRLLEVHPSAREPMVTAYKQIFRGRMSVRDNGYVRILVEDEEPRERREQPPAGWDCPTY
jgi:hypothetical protein